MPIFRLETDIYATTTPRCRERKTTEILNYPVKILYVEKRRVTDTSSQTINQLIVILVTTILFGDRRQQYRIPRITYYRLTSIVESRHIQQLA